jgi:hypothetical protein
VTRARTGAALPSVSTSSRSGRPLGGPSCCPGVRARDPLAAALLLSLLFASPLAAQEGCGYLERSWSGAQRALLGRIVGGAWRPAERRWVLGPLADRWDPAHRGYESELLIRPALAMAWTGCGAGLRQELSSFYLAWTPRLATLSAVRTESRRRSAMTGLARIGPDEARVLPWVQRVGPIARIGECAVCSAQFFHPAARLVHLIARTPRAERSLAEREFVREYGPLITRDHVLRYGYAAAWQDLEVEGLPGPLVLRWEALTGGARPAAPAYRWAFSDRDLFLVATAAELLAAYRADPGLVPIAGQLDSLRRLVHAGVARIRAAGAAQGSLRDPDGRPVSGRSYFDGDFDAHPDHRYAGYAGATFPMPGDSAPPVRGGWDVSHFHRMPIALRSLWDARDALGADTIARTEMAELVRQYALVMFTGDTLRPTFRNYTDGRDGWYRVLPDGRRGFGHPPSDACDAHDDKRPCLAQNAIQGWGQIAFADPAIGRVHEALRRLATTRDSVALRFRDRVYWANWWSFAPRGPTGTEWYPRLYWAMEAEYRLGRTP